MSEKKQDYYVDCYFRQSWYDTRLIFNETGGITALPMNWQFLNKIWKPDTFFVNGKKSKMHKITVPNKFLRIAPDGKVSYSQRLTIHARCRMHLLKFPLDSQICPLWIGSYGYNTKDLIYKWREPSSISLDDYTTAQFLITKLEQGVVNNLTNRLIESGFRNDSVAFLHFHLERQTGFFLLQFYFPLLIIVMCSWVEFWIVKTDVPARCGLGITTVLSVTKIGFGGKGKPQVGYPTALDIYVIICLGSVFAALCEFAIMNFISVTMNRIKTQKEELKKAKEAIDKAEQELQIDDKNEEIEETDEVKVIEDNGNPFEDDPNEIMQRRKSIETMDASTTTDDFYKRARVFDLNEEMNKVKDQLLSAWEHCKGNLAKLKIKPVEQMYIYTNTEEALDYIDDCSKFYFPAAYMVMMTVYWTCYLYIIQDKLEMDTF